jgi:hypothetical protein
VNAAICPRRFCGGVLDHATVDGRLVERCRRCDRRRAGLYQDCPSRVYGTIGKALRCARCARARRLEQDRAHRDDPLVRARRNKHYREDYAKRPEVIARRREQHRRWRKANPDIVRQQKRRFLLGEGSARANYLALQRRHNARPERIERKRAAALARYYERHPVRPDPRCSGCGVVIAWTPRHGRPRLTCDRCCAPSELIRRERGYNRSDRRPRRKETRVA